MQEAIIRLSTSQTGGEFGSRSGKELTFNKATLRLLIEAAYRVRDFQISGGPAWIDSDLYDVRLVFTSKPGSEFFEKPMQPLQEVLKDRFHLKLHRETRQLPVYTLMVSKIGAELRRSRVASCATFEIGRYAPPPGERPKDCSGVETGPNLQLNETLDAVGMSVPSLIDILSRELDHIVIDKTGLPGLFDVYLEWNREATRRRLSAPIAEDQDSPSLFEAVEQQLGLKLEAGKGPVEVLVVDHAEKPRL